MKHPIPRARWLPQRSHPVGCPDPAPGVHLGTPPLDPTEIRCAYLEGAATSVHRQLAGSAFLIPFALALGAGPVHLGLIGAAPFVGRLLQLAASPWAQRVGARAAAIRGGFAERIAVAAIASLPFWAAGSPAAPWMMIGLLCLSATCGEMYTPGSTGRRNTACMSRS